MNEGELLDDRYRLSEVLGRGGMGVVWRAFDERLERFVAVKVLPPDDQRVAGARERFVKEARRTAQLRHANIVEVFDVGQTPRGDLFFVMELLSGELLSERARRIGPMDLETFGPIALQLCEAVGAAHAAGVVHRDLKPENVMLVAKGETGEGDGIPEIVDWVKVLDFGIAKELGGITKLTETGTFIGTAEYMSPEQIRGDALDVRSDVYSLGALFYRLLAGAPLYETENVATLIHRHLSVPPDPLRARAPSVPLPVEAVVMRCLAKEPALRYASASALLRALATALGAVHASQVPTAPGRAESAAVPALVPELELRPAPARPVLPMAPPFHGAANAAVGSAPLELELAPAPRPLPIAPPAPIVPIAEFGAHRHALAPMPKPPPPRWLAPLGFLPVTVGKRVAAYSFLAAVITHVFFGSSYLSFGALLLLAGVAALGVWVRARSDAAEGLEGG
jgi:serine/threonine-protein kinase